MAINRKLVAFLLSVALLLSTLIIPGVVTVAGDTDELDIWDGTVATSFADTSAGTEADPILIQTPEELAFAVKNGGGEGAHYQLTADMYLNDVSGNNWTSTARAWDHNTTFQGTIDGAGHIIYGLYTPVGTSNPAGLVALAHRYGANFKNLGIRYASLSSTNNVGAFVGAATEYGATISISQCFVDETVSLSTSSQYASGFVGCMGRMDTSAYCNITDSYSLANVSAPSYRNSSKFVCGYNGKFTVKNSYTIGSISSTAARNEYVTTESNAFTNSYATVAADSNCASTWTVITSDQMTGKNALTNMPNLTAGIWTAVVGKTPVLTQFKDKLVEEEKPLVDENGIWTGNIALAFADESVGTETDPILISNPGELALAIKSGGSGKFYKLTDDMYLNDVSNANWYENANNHAWDFNTEFNGTIDGDGNIIYGLWTPEGTTNHVGLVSRANRYGTNFKNLGISKARLVSSGNVGAFVGYSDTYNANASMDQCFADDTVTLTSTSGFAAGFVGVSVQKGTATVTINNSYSKAVVSANKVAAGMLNGYKCSFTVKNSYAVGVIAGANQANHANQTTDNNPFENSYATVAASGYINPAWTVVGAVDMMGGNAKTAMPGLDYTNVWLAMAGSTPILKQFDGKIVVEADEPSVDEKGIWNGNVATRFSDMSAGTEADPILITNPGELAFMLKSGGGDKYYKLDTDIKLNDVSSKKWTQNANNNAWFSGLPFKGHFDGAGHIIEGIWYPETTTGHAGFIPQIGAGSIKNLGIRYSRIYTSGIAGAFIGYNESNDLITISNCFADETVSVYGGSRAGGFVGQTVRKSSYNAVDIINCYTKADVTGKNEFVSGFFGEAYNSTFTIRNSYSVGKGFLYANGSSRVSLSTEEDKYANTYSDVAGSGWTADVWTGISKADMYGELARNSMPGLDYTNTWKIVENGTPILKLFKDKITGEDIDTSLDGETYESGNGTKENPYVIKTADQLIYLVKSKETSGKYYKLANDIYVNDTTKANWKETATEWFTNLSDSAFKGYLEGNGFAIHGLYINQTPAANRTALNGNNVAGLFSYINSGATVTNVHIRDSYISGAGYVGAIAGRTAGSEIETANIIGCSVDETVTLRGFELGGMVGCAHSAPVKIYFCYSTANITGNGDFINGMVGDTWSNAAAGNIIVNCYMIGNKPIRDNKRSAKEVISVYSDIESMYATLVGKNSMYGDAAKNAMPDLDWGKAWYTVNGKTPQLKVIPEGLIPNVDEGVKGRVWSGSFATKFAGGTGTKADPYLIETPEQLAYLVMKAEITKDSYFKLTADIKLNDTSKANWEKTARQWFTDTQVLTGHLDGNYHVITGLYLDTVDKEWVGLFTYITEGASIERLGIDKSTIKCDGEVKNTYGGAFVGGITDWDGYQGANWDGDMSRAPLFSECFVGPGVKLSGFAVGGFVGGGKAGVKFHNCYAVPSIPTYLQKGGSFFGDIWESRESNLEMINCYGSTPDREPIGNGRKYDFDQAWASYTNVYVDGFKKDGVDITASGLYAMQDTRAAKLLKGFDFSKIWKTVKNGTPVLRGFANAEKYSCKREAPKVKIEFITGDDASQHEPIWGFPMGDKVPYDKFPTPTRYGYVFDGWHMFDTLDYKYNIKYFANFNTSAYAKWVKLGFNQDFDGETNPEYDINAGAQYYQPGVVGYNPKFIHGGLRSMHMLPDSSEAPMFLVGYETRLEIGKEYDVNFWMTSKENGATGQVEILHALYGDVNDDIVGHEVGLEFTGLTAGEWVQYRVTIVANAPYLVIRTTPGVELFFDDFLVVPTGKEGEVGKVDGFNPGLLSGEPEGFFGGLINSGKDIVNSVLALGVVGIIILVAAAVLLLAVIALIIILIVRSSKKKKAAKAAALAAATEAETSGLEQETPPVEE